jgi:hypothetical protein
MRPIGYQLPTSIFRYVFAVSWPHQIVLVMMTVVTFLLEVAPLEIQRRVVNDLVKERSFKTVATLRAAYASVVSSVVYCFRCSPISSTSSRSSPAPAA